MIRWLLMPLIRIVKDCLAFEAAHLAASLLTPGEDIINRPTMGARICRGRSARWLNRHGFRYEFHGVLRQVCGHRIRPYNMIVFLHISSGQGVYVLLTFDSWCISGKNNRGRSSLRPPPPFIFRTPQDKARCHWLNECCPFVLSPSIHPGQTYRRTTIHSFSGLLGLHPVIPAGIQRQAHLTASGEVVDRQKDLVRRQVRTEPLNRFERTTRSPLPERGQYPINVGLIDGDGQGDTPTPFECRVRI